MERRGMSGWNVFIIILIIIFVLIGIVCLVFVFTGKNYDELYKEMFASGEIVNPSASLTTEEAMANFDETFVLYILYSIKAYNLHEPPLSSDLPKIEFYVGEDIYSAVVSEGFIDVSREAMTEKDIIIRTSKQEGVKMVQDSSHIEKSFESGESSIEMVASKTKLATKGYLTLYTDLTGKSVTGAFIKGF